MSEKMKMIKFSKRFIEKVSDLGCLTEINDETFYLVFEPHNHLGAKVIDNEGLIDIAVMKIDGYTPLVMWTARDQLFWNLTEDEAFEILKEYFERN